MKNRFQSCIIPVMGTLSLTISGCSKNDPAEKPNIILILADDMGYSDIGCFGSEIKTPTLDKLAERGIRMTQFYNASRSCPTRASLLTGLYQHQAGVGDMVADLGYPSYQGYLNENCVTLAEALKYNGYQTFMSGKWHVGNRPEVHPLQRGFDRYFGLIDGAGSYYKPIAYRPNMKPVRWMLDDKDFTPPDTGFYFTDAVADYALEFLKEREEPGDPYFLYLAFTAPHWPLHALPEDIEKYRGKYMEGWGKLREERYHRMLEMKIIDTTARLSPIDERSPLWDTLSEESKINWDMRMAVYAAMIDRLDQNIGKVVSFVEKSGDLDNTLIIFLSDNGGCHESTRSQAAFLNTAGPIGSPDSFDAYEYPWANASNTPFRWFKHWVHEGGISSPFIAFYPAAIKPGQKSDVPGHIIDIMPTLLDYAGGDYPITFKERSVAPMEGVSLRPLFSGKKINRENPLFWEHEGNRAVRDGGWKLVSTYNYAEKKFNKWELYDLDADRSELNDLSASQPERMEKMIGLFEAWSQRAGVIPKNTIDNN